MPISNSTTFLHSFFLGCDTYSADVVDKKVERFVVQECIDEKMIDTVYHNDKRLYRILPKGKKVIEQK